MTLLFVIFVFWVTGKLIDRDAKKYGTRPRIKGVLDL
jgi:hypothetical protein